MFLALTHQHFYKINDNLICPVIHKEFSPKRLLPQCAWPEFISGQSIPSIHFYITSQLSQMGPNLIVTSSPTTIYELYMSDYNFVCGHPSSMKHCNSWEVARKKWNKSNLAINIVWQNSDFVIKRTHLYTNFEVHIVLCQVNGDYGVYE